MVDMNKFEKFWNGKSPLEKRLLVFVLILSVILLIVLLTMVLRGDSETCNSVQCIRAATHILDYVDFSTNPCDDFHQFICGGFFRKSSEYNKFSVLTRMKEKVDKQIESIIISNNDTNDDVNSLEFQKKFYRSCMNRSAIEEDENDTFLTLLDALGGWPIIKHNFWDEHSFDWKTTMVKARKLGLSYQKLIGIVMDFDDEENKTVVQILPPDDVEYISNEVMEPHVELMRDVAILLHAPSLGLNSELRYVVNFQNELYRIISRARNRSTEATKMEIRKVQERFPRTSWVQFLNNLLSGAVTVRETDLISLKSEQFLIDLEVLLLKTSKRTQSNYIIWKTIEKFIPFLTESVRNRYEKFQRQFLGKFIKKTRREICVDLSRELFDNVAEIEYIRKYTDSETKKYVKDIFQKIKRELLQKLKSNFKNLDGEILEQVENLKILIGGPEEIFNKEETEKILGYNDLTFFDDDLVKIVTKVSINRNTFFFKEFAEKSKENERKQLILNIIKRFIHVNAYYMDYMNILLLPVPLLQEIFYEKNRPNSMNYGALVTTIGHEITHSLGKFDNKTYKTEGKFRFEYNQAFFDIFRNSTLCFEEQYNRYTNGTVDENEVTIQNSNETLEENIADFVGTQMAYTLYQEHVHQNGVEQKLPGVDLTSNQLFWVMSGTFLCRPQKSENIEKIFAPHFHSDEEYRINYRLRNLPEFSRDFHCSSGSFMNPDRKCSFFSE